MAPKRQLRVAVAVLGVLLISQLPAGASDHPDASDPPRVAGPLIGLSIGCEDNGPARPGEAKGQGCAWRYDLLPLDSKVREDFSAFWIQMEIDPGKHTCAYQMGFEVTGITNGRIISATPARSRTLTNEAPSRTRLEVDGNRAAIIGGTISQRIQLNSGRIAVEKSSNHYSFRWSGASRSKVMAAVGIEVAREGTPPEITYSWSQRQRFGVGACHS